MQPSFPSAWIFFILPFASSGVIAHTRPVSGLRKRHNRLTLSTAVVGLAAFAAGIVGLLPIAWTIVAAVAGGAVAGFSIFSITPKQTGGDDDDSEDGGWGRRPPPEDEPPPPAGGGGEIDWEQFDRLRAEWAREPSLLP